MGNDMEMSETLWFSIVSNNPLTECKCTKNHHNIEIYGGLFTDPFQKQDDFAKYCKQRINTGNILMHKSGVIRL
jgi:hypothetical protein